MMRNSAFYLCQLHYLNWELALKFPETLYIDEMLSDKYLLVFNVTFAVRTAKVMETIKTVFHLDWFIQLPLK